MVEHGSRIRLEHVETHRNLHTHLDRQAPVSGGHHEATCFELREHGDPKDDWELIIEGQKTWITEQKVRFRNAETHEFLHSHLGKSDPIFTLAFQEVTVATANDDNDFWVCESGDHIAQRRKVTVSEVLSNNRMNVLNIAAGVASLTGWDYLQPQFKGIGDNRFDAVLHCNYFNHAIIAVSLCRAGSIRIVFGRHSAVASRKFSLDYFDLRLSFVCPLSHCNFLALCRLFFWFACNTFSRTASP